MSCDAINFELFDRKPAIYVPMQVPPSAGYQIDWRAFLHMNLPAKPPVAFVDAKQVLTVKTATIDSLAEEFPNLVRQWKEETFFISSLGKQFTHPAYVRIMAMGKEGIPLVLREMQNSQDNWFYALKFMAGKDIAAGIENFEDAKAAWLEWGYSKNYI
jgi:hypothetical protein